MAYTSYWDNQKSWNDLPLSITQGYTLEEAIVLGNYVPTDIATPTQLEAKVNDAYNNIAASFTASADNLPPYSSQGAARIDMLYKIGTHLSKAQEQMDIVCRLVDELASIPHEAV